MLVVSPITIKLDRVRAIRWTERAKARNASLARPVAFTALSRGKNRLYAVCALLWAALVDRDHEFESPEDLAEYLQTDDQQLAAFKAISAMLEEAFPEKKSPPSVDSSPTGPSPSSTAGSPQASTGGP